MADVPSIPGTNPPPDPATPRIRTYAADLAEEMRERGTTLSSIVTAEAAKKKEISYDDQAAATSGRRRALIAGGLALFLIVLGIATVSAAYIFRSKNQTPVITTSIIFPNKTKNVDTVAGPLATTLVNIRLNEQLSLGEVEKVVLTKDGVALSPQESATALGLPPALAREATDLMVGVHEFDHTQPFIIIKVAAYDRAFAATLAWESDMARALGPFFAPLSVPDITAAPRTTFTDAVVQNLDARVSQKDWPILYAFPTQGLLVITTNEYTLREVITRLQSGQ